MSSLVSAQELFASQLACPFFPQYFWWILNCTGMKIQEASFLKLLPLDT